MFCDLVGATELGQRLDPEELREVLGEYQRTCARSIERFEGTIAQYLGDGVLAYFGFPQAHEDDAERALRAGLALQSSLAELSAGATAGAAARIEARVGVHTGPVVVGQIGSLQRRETLALGDTPNLAARIQAQAEAGAVVASEATLRLVPGLFETVDLGAQTLKGVREPVRLARVVRQTGARSRLEAAAAMTPLVGRTAEIDGLVDRWQAARRGEGHVVVLTSEAGVGKSRLVHAFRQRVAGDPHTWLDAYCSPFSSSTPFQPVIDILERGLGLAGISAGHDRLASLEGLVLPGAPPEQLVPYIAAAMGLPPSERFPMPQIDPELRRERTLAAFTSMLVGVAAIQPVVLCIEDLHWCDPSTLALLARMIDAVADRSVLLLVTARSEFAPGWHPDRSHVSTIRLSRLGERDARSVVEETLARRQLPAAVVARIVDQADGVPLFLEELAKSVIESGRVAAGDRGDAPKGSPHDLAIPATLRDSLMARLDRLSTAKYVAQLAANLGREFSWELLEAVADCDGPTLRSGLDQLVEAEVVFVRGEPPAATYVFKHALLQDTAYQSQLKSARRHRHAHIADVLTARFPEHVDAEPELLAHHCERGGLHERAARHYLRAGQRSAERVAHAEAADYLERGLRALAELPPGPARDSLEIALRAARGGPLTALHGHAGSESVANYARLRELAENAASAEDQLAAWLPLVGHYTHSSDMGAMLEVGRALVRTAEPVGATPLLALGHLLIGNSGQSLQSVETARVELQKVLDLCDAGALPPPATVHEPDMEAWARASYAITLLNQGRVVEGRRSLDRAIERARAIDHANSLGVALLIGCAFLYMSFDVDGVAACADEAWQLATAAGFRAHAAQSAVYRAWVRAARGAVTAAAEVIEPLEGYSATGSRSTQAWLHGVSGDALRQAGYTAEARALLDRALQIVAATQEVNLLPWLLRLQAALSLDADPGAWRDAERLLRPVIAGCRGAGAPLMELVEALVLAPALARAGQVAAARELVEVPLRGIDAAADGALPLLAESRAFLASLDA